MIEPSLLDDARFDTVQRELLDITWQMLNAIHTGDAATYAAFPRRNSPVSRMCARTALTAWSFTSP